MQSSVGVNLGAAVFWQPTALLYSDAIRTCQSGQGFLANPPVSGQDVIIFDGLSAAAGAGTYQFVATGKCTLNVGASQSGVTASPTSYDPAGNTSKATLTVSPANWPATSQVAIRVTWAAADTPPTNVQLWRPNSTPGDLFYQPFLSLLAPFSTIRFMDATATNGSTLADWSKRPVPTQRNYPSGIAWEDAVLLCAQTKKDGWLCIPYLVANAPMQLQPLCQTLAALIPAGSTQSFYVEISNEVWNSAFPQWKQNQSAAASNAAVHFDGMGDPNILGWRQTAYLAVQFAQAIAKAYGVANWRQTPIRPVLGVQWGNPSVAQYGLDFVAKQYGAPAQYLYGIAQAPYVTVDWSKNPQTPSDLIAALKTSDPGGSLAVQNHAIAGQYGVRSLAYESGFDFGQNPANSAIRAQAQILPAAGVALIASLASWFQGGGELTCHYQACYQSQNSGNWGAVEDPMNLVVPKYLALAGASPLCWRDDSALPLPAPQPSPTPAPVQTPPLFSGKFTGKDGTGYNVSVTAG